MSMLFPFKFLHWQIPRPGGSGDANDSFMDTVDIEAAVLDDGAEHSEHIADPRGSDDLGDLPVPSPQTHAVEMKAQDADHVPDADAFTGWRRDMLSGYAEQCFGTLDNLAIRAKTLCNDASTSAASSTQSSASERDIQGCRLYLDCLQFLRKEYPTSPACLSHDGLHSKRAEDLPACFGTLAMFVADHIMWGMDIPDLETAGDQSVQQYIVLDATAMAQVEDIARLVHSLPVASAADQQLPVLDATAAAQVEDSTRLVKSLASAADSLSAIGHAVVSWDAFRLLMGWSEGPQDRPCALVALFLTDVGDSRDVSEDDHYHALFLDCALQLAHRECSRRGRLELASPMPWSYTSTLELFELRRSKSPMSPPVVPTAELVRSGSREEMDLLRWTFASLIDIPWLGAPHDGYPFCANLSSYVETRRPTGTLSTFPRDAALWLSAMTFGVLECVTRMRIPEQLLLSRRPGDGATVVSGLLLTRFMTMWFWQCAMDKHRDSKHLREHGEEVARLLARVAEALEETLGSSGSPHESILVRGGVSIDDSMVIISGLALIYSAIRQVVVTNRTVGWEDLPDIRKFDLRLGQWASYILTPLRKYWTWKLTAKGWCLCSLTRVVEGITADKFFLFPTILRLRPYIQHSRDEHRRCEQGFCRLETITDIEAQRPRHVEPSCQCKNVTPVLDDVLRRLRRGIIPVVVYEEDTLHVVSSEDRPYVAISHVWSQGMGGTTEEGLPACTVRRVASLAQRLLPEYGGAFWIDSLCVPEASAERKRAIMLMARTYRDATRVLVIDESIRSLCSTRRPWPENVVRIAASAWMRRMWTLQEGILARELYMEFMEGPEQICPATEERQLYPNSQLFPLLFLKARDDHDPRSPHAAQTSLTTLVTLLRRRTTSKMEDELLAIADLLPKHIDIEALLAVEDGPYGLAQRRMKAFLLQLRNVPRDIPFGLANRLSIPGFTWAPSTLSHESGACWGSEGTAMCTEEGLFAQYLCAFLEKPLTEPSTPEGALIRHRPSKSVYAVTWNAPSEQLASIDALLFTDDDYPGSQGADFNAIAVHAIIPQHSPVGERSIPGEMETLGIPMDAALHHFKYVSRPLFKLSTGTLTNYIFKPRLHGQNSLSEVLDVEEWHRVWVRLV
ncbi:hypothetical protein PYCCODRAFT_1469729 [Trametes coccinea BRFM310]|uniref:Heterokaryon incompatibility domain-containing protein n=1 Tax=Trametes coccinea (strain BRFM310) TaxID=1353009 RepID=A0A1Y2IH91_TRAC3|nr:hypothetical protein PYCCODRAFT_1469729 [Trametes coccinea BRFM310]